MRRELKNLLNYLSKYSEQGKGLFWGTDLQWCIYYLFLRRYDAIRKDFDLPNFGYDLDKYSHEDGKYYPFEDFILPFFKLLREKNPGTFEGKDLEAFFNRSDPLTSLQPSEVKSFNKAIKDCGVTDFSLDAYSVAEFDVFFTKLIDKTKSADEKGVWIRRLDKPFAEFIRSNIPQEGSNLFIGDETAEIAYNINSDQSEKNITGNFDSILWYYLRVILTGKLNLKIYTNELLSFIEAKPDFIFLNPPVGRINKSNRNQLSQEFEIDFKWNAWEIIYAHLALRCLKSSGKGLFLMPSKFLYAQNNDCKNLRKELTKDNVVKTIIRLPRGLFGPATSISFTLLEIDYSYKGEHVKFVDGFEITSQLSPKDVEGRTNFFNEVSNHWKRGLEFYPYVQSVKKDRITKNNYSWAFSNYFNPGQNPSKHIRSREEVLKPLTEALRPLDLKYEKRIGNVPFLSMSQLAENLAEYQIDVNELPQPSEIKRAKKLDRSAILIGKIVGSVKPSYYKHQGQDIYIRPNVLALGVPSKYDPQYIVQEIRSDFVIKQFQKIESSDTIPSYSSKVLDNIYLRIPPLDRQRELIKDELSNLAKESLDKLETSDKRFKVIEKELLTSFKHDFGKVLLKVSSNINTIDGYLNRLADDGIIKLDEDIFPSDNNSLTISKLLDNLKRNHKQAQIYLEDEVKKLKGDIASEKVILDLSEVLKRWKERQEESFYSINMTDDQQYTQRESSRRNKDLVDYSIQADENDILRILNNFLDNAINYGFEKDRSDNEFRLHLQFGLTEEDSTNIIKLHIGNNGEPFPKDFSCEDFFDLGKKGYRSKGDGVGGFSIKRAVENIGGEIFCSSSVLPDEEYPVQFEIQLKHEIIDRDE